MALKVYIKSRATPKVIASFAERGEFDKILIYSKQVRGGERRVRARFVAFEHDQLVCNIVGVICTPEKKLVCQKEKRKKKKIKKNSVSRMSVRLVVGMSGSHLPMTMRMM